MIGIIIALALSWLILYVFEKKNLQALGFLPPGKRTFQFLIGFLVTAILCFIVEYTELLLSSAQWKLNEKATVSMILKMFWWDFRSVFTEELIFRGAILYVLIRVSGASKAILLSAITFGIYHWFSFGILGDIIPMAVVFIGTGIMGFAWALAFYKTGSILMPLGLHLGWNFIFNSIFSNGPLGQGLVLTEGGAAVSDWYSLVGLCGVPVIVFLFVKFIVPVSRPEILKEKGEITVNNI